jgi:hypothetical protein
MAATATSFCKHCEDDSSKLQACSACHGVCYSNVPRQKADWPKHNQRCKKVRKDATAVFIEIPPNQGNGLGATMKTHIFANRAGGIYLSNNTVALHVVKLCDHLLRN